MYVYVYVYIYIHVYVYIYICESMSNLLIYEICMHKHMCVCIYIYYTYTLHYTTYLCNLMYITCITASTSHVVKSPSNRPCGTGWVKLPQSTAAVPGPH